MPRLRPPKAHDRKPTGRPPRVAENPSLCIAAAWLKDYRGLTFAGVERELELVGDAKRTYSRTVERYVRDGRLTLQLLGILPWAAWDLQTFRERALREWWRRPHFLDALETWALECRAAKRQRSWGRLWEAGSAEDLSDAQRAARQSCPDLPVTEADHRIGRHVAVMDTLSGGTEWRLGFRWTDLHRDAQLAKADVLESRVQWTRRLATQSRESILKEIAQKDATSEY
jgi:hypothetical protein